MDCVKILTQSIFYIKSMNRPIINKITDRTSAFSQNGSMITVYRIDSENAVLIDSGLGENERIIYLLRDEHLNVAAVLHTHLHTDHNANDRLLMQYFNCEVYAGERDLKTMRSRELIVKERGVHSPQYVDELYELCNYPMTIIPDDAKSVSIKGAEFTVIPLRGHSLGHMGIATPDGVCALGDALIMPDILGKMKLPYTVNEKSALEAMMKIKELDYPHYVIAHNNIIEKENIDQIADYNLNYEYRLLEKIEQIMSDKNLDANDKRGIITRLGIGRLFGRRTETTEFALDARIEYLNNH